MTEPTALPRPRQVTLAAWLIMLGSVFVVATVFERIAGLHTLETQDAVAKFLSEPPGDGLGLGVEGVLSVLRVLAMVAGGCATAAAILGFQVLQRSRSARLGLSVLAAPLLLSGLAVGGFMSSVVAAASVMLWFQPARDWFDGITREAAPQRQRPATPPPVTGPRAFPGFGSLPASGRADAGLEAPSGLPDAAQPDAPPPARPAGVTWACALTWIFASLAILVMGASMVAVAMSPDLLFEELDRQRPELADQGVTHDTIVSLTYAMGGLVIVWSILAIILAVLVFRRTAWARLPLLVSAATTAAICVLGTIGQVLMALPLAAAIVTWALLVRPDVRAWFSAGRR